VPGDMKLLIRKSLYTALGSGALFSGSLALIGALGATAVFLSPPPDMGLAQRMAMLLFIAGCLCSVVGTVSGFVAIFSLPIVRDRKRNWLTAGIAAGVLPATAMFVTLLGDGDEGASVYLCGMPAAVGCILLLELWWPTLKRQFVMNAGS
jgi:hypothetical protein